MFSVISKKLTLIKLLYYINTNEIPGELSSENMVSSHVKRSPLLWLHNKFHLSQEEKYLSEMVWHCIGVYIIIELYMAAWRNEFFLCFVSPRGHVKSSIS